MPSSFKFSKKTKIRKVVVYYFGTYGIEFFDQKKESVLKIGVSHNEKKELNLEGGKAKGSKTN